MQRRCAPNGTAYTELQDVFITHSTLGMSTTAGSRAFVEAKSSTNAAIVQHLLNAGMIILGKTNLTVSSIPNPPQHWLVH